MPRIWLPLAIVLLIGAGLFLFLQPEDESPGPQTRTETTSIEKELDQAPEIASDAERISGDTESESLERIELSLPDPGPQAKYAEHAEEGILISVVDGSTKESIPHADVMVIDTSITDMRLVEVAIQSRPDFELLFLDLGVTYRADARGQVMIPDPIGDLLIAGRTPTHFNFAFDVDDDAEEFTLRLNEVELLKVKVVDDLGRPVKGAPVSLRMHNNSFSQDLIQAHTNADGIAALKIFNLIKIELADDEVSVALLALTDDPIERLIDLKDLPKEPPVLTMPQLGQVEVKVLDDLGEPVKDSFMVDLAIITDAEFQAEGDGQLDYWTEAHPHITTPSRNGMARFPLVQPGTKLRAIAVSRDQEKRDHVDGFGPARTGEKTTLTVMPAVDRAVVVGRILNEEGAVGANLSLKSRLSARSNGSSFSHNETLRTDAEGRFRMVLEEDYEDGGTRELTITMRKTKRKPKRSVMVDLSKHYDPGVHDLGDLVVMIPPLLAEGTVLAPNGKPVPKADVLLEVANYYGENQEHLWWNGLWELREETDRDGKFEIRGHVKDAVYRVAARHDDYQQADQRINLGASGLQLSLKQAVRLEGRFLLDDSIDAELLEAIVLWPDPDNSNHERSQSTDLARTGKFQFEHLPEGPAKLRLDSAISDEILFHLDDIPLSAATGPTHDLGDIDLRNRLTSLQLTVLDARGMPIQNPMVRPLGQDWGQTSHANPVQVITSGASLDLRVSAKGYRPQELRGISSDTIVTLLDGIPVHVQLTNGTLLPGDFEVVARLAYYPDGPDGEKVSGMEGKTEQGRDLLKGTVHAAGSYMVHFTLRRTSNHGSQAWALPGGEQMIDVLDRTTPQVFTVEVPKNILKFADEKTQKNF